jgi:hypothetical protein
VLLVFICAMFWLCWRDNKGEEAASRLAQRVCSSIAEHKKSSGVIFNSFQAGPKGALCRIAEHKKSSGAIFNSFQAGPKGGQ